MRILSTIILLLNVYAVSSTPTTLPQRATTITSNNEKFHYNNNDIISTPITTASDSNDDVDYNISNPIEIINRSKIHPLSSEWIKSCGDNNNNNNNNNNDDTNNYETIGIICIHSNSNSSKNISNNNIDDYNSDTASPFNITNKTTTIIRANNNDHNNTHLVKDSNNNIIIESSNVNNKNKFLSSSSSLSFLSPYYYNILKPAFLDLSLLNKNMNRNQYNTNNNISTTSTSYYNDRIMLLSSLNNTNNITQKDNNNTIQENNMIIKSYECNNLLSSLSYNDKYDNIKNTLECFGCVCDSIVILLSLEGGDDDDDDDHSSIFNLMIDNMINGIQRRQQQRNEDTDDESNNDNIHIHVIVVSSSSLSSNVKITDLIKKCQDTINKMNEDKYYTTTAGITIQLNIITPNNLNMMHDVCYSENIETTNDIIPRRRKKDISMHLFPSYIHHILKSLNPNNYHNGDNKKSSWVQSYYHTSKKEGKETITITTSNKTKNIIKKNLPKKQIINEQQKKYNTRINNFLTNIKLKTIEELSILELYQEEQSMILLEKINNDEEKLTKKYDDEYYNTILLSFCNTFSQNVTNVLQTTYNDFDLFLLQLIENFNNNDNDDISIDDNSTTTINAQIVNDFQSKKKQFLETIVGNQHVHRLYQNQLEIIRDVLGKQYENKLQQLFATATATTTSVNKRKKQQEEQIITNEIKLSIDNFRSASFQSIPIICRLGHICYMYTTTTNTNKEDNLYTYIKELDGFINDIKQITFIYKEMDYDWNIGCTSMLSDEDDDENNNKKKPKKWYHKLLYKCLVLSINYLQGWLALQHLQREAEQRDSLLPKFPLF